MKGVDAKEEISAKVKEQAYVINYSLKGNIHFE